MADYREEFPDFGKLDVNLPEGFADVSWANDACPSFLNEELCLLMFIDYADPELREFPASDRFSLQTVDEQGMVLQDASAVGFVSMDEVLAVVEKVRIRALEGTSAAENSIVENASELDLLVARSANFAAKRLGADGPVVSANR